MRPYLFVFLALAPVIGFSVTAPTLTLTKTNGVNVAGQIISCSDTTGLIRLRGKGGTSQHKFEELTEESQGLIKQWKTDRNFLKRNNLTATFRASSDTSSTNILGTVTDHRTNTKKEKTIGTKTETLRTCSIRLENKSDTPFNALDIEYRIFYTIKISNTQTAQCQFAGSVQCDTLAPQGVFSFETTPFISSIQYNSAPGINWTGMPQNSFEHILGTLLCIRTQNVTGEWIEREIEHGEVPRKRDRADFQKLYN